MPGATKPAHHSGVTLLKIAVLGDAARLRRWHVTELGVFNHPTEFCKLLLIGKADVGVVVPKAQKQLRNFLVHLSPLADQLSRSSSRLVVYAPAEYVRTPGLSEMRAKRLIEFLPDSVSRDDFQRFLASFAELPKSENRTTNIFSPNPSMVSLHSGSGRLDIKKVADLFDLSVSDLARQIAVDAKTALKTPDSITVHRALIPYEQVASGFKAMGGDVHGFRIWLNSPNSALGGKSPNEVLAEGKAKELAGVVQGALLGQPA
jgi:hypothetical protein